jgi:type I restriction enzyme S subunit
MREDWIECTFEDLLDYEQPTKYIVRSTKYSDDFKTPVLTAGKSFIKGYTNETDGIFDELPTIIFDDFTTATQFVDFEFKVKSSAMKILVPTSKLVNMKFVYNCIQVNQVRNDTHKRYWISVYAKKKILLPSLVEQNTILSKTEELFSDLDNGIANFKKAQEQLKIYRQAVLKKAFEGELTAAWRAKQSNLPTADELLKQIKEERQNHYDQQIEDWKKAVKVWEKNGKVGKKPSKPTQPKELPPLKKEELEELSKLPSGWKWEKIGLNFLSLDQGWSPKCENYPAKIEEWGVIKTTAVQANSFEEINNKKLPLKLSPRIQHELVKGDILITRAGPRNRVGICCLVNNVRSKLINCDKVYRIKVIVSNPIFIVYMLNSPAFSKELEKTKSGISDSGVNLKQDVFLKMPVPLCSLEEQNQIVQEIESRLSVCDKMEQSITESIEKAEALRQSILKKAFEGKLLSQAEIELCKKETDYEPASELLKKIQAEKLATLRQAQDAKKKKPTVKKKSNI